MRVAACVKWIDTRPEIDGLTGHVRTDGRSFGFSAADLAAVETAIAVADRWAGSVVIVCASPPGADERLDSALRGLAAAGGASGGASDLRLVRVGIEPDAPSETVAVSLAAALGHTSIAAGSAVDSSAVDLVICGDYSMDRGSGSVPAFLAHHLGSAQALGLVEVAAGTPGSLEGRRRLGGGRSERLSISTPAVISVEGSVADLRRASLSATLSARAVSIVVLDGVVSSVPTPFVGRTEPLRPRARELAPPSGDDARTRILALTGALVDRDPPRTLELDPEDAADAIIEQLRSWGYLDDAPPVG